MSSDSGISTDSPKRSIDSLARAFRAFAEAECGEEPVYDALCRAAADDERTLALLWEAPLVQQKPNLLLASVHDLVLRGAGHPFRRYFPSAGGNASVDEGFLASFTDFRDEYELALRERIATRSTQTNEIGRCAVLYPCLARLASARGRERIALLDFGTSAGLNLGVDSYRYDYGSFCLGAEASPTSPTIPCELRGPHAPRDAVLVPVTTRLGIDLAPVDVHDADAVRWLRACLWPNDAARAKRFDLAVAIAKQRAWTVRREEDGLAAIETWLANAPDDAVRVVFHSWVLFYFSDAERERFGVEMERLVERYDAVWLSAEGETLRIGGREPPPPSGYPGCTVWTARSRGGFEELARSHPHGKWLDWGVTE